MRHAGSPAPLTALRAFDAAARHMSFAKAAEELHVTPAALSFQIKSLETHLGAKVFRRLNRAVELTEAGEALASGVADAFETLAGAWRAAGRTLEGDTLTVTAGPAFTAKWLAPRLYDFAQAHPDIELRFAASLKRMDLQRDGVDVAIRYTTNVSDAALHAKRLATEWVSPVMTPEAAERYGSVDALQSAPLLHDESIDFLRPSVDWAAWFRLMGVDAPPAPSLHFSHADHAIDAALAGAGVALGRRSLVVKDIAEGRLVAPFPVALNTGAGFWFLCLNGTEDRPAIKALRSWVQTEIEKLAYVTEAMLVVTHDTSPSDVAQRLAARGTTSVR